MKKWIFGVVTLLGIIIWLTLIEIRKGPDSPAEIVLLTWPDYTPPELLLAFEQRNGIKVVVRTYQSNKSLLNLLRATPQEHDVVLLSHAMVDIAIKHGLLALSMPREMENFVNVDPRWANLSFDPERRYTVPYAWGSAAFVVNSTVVSNHVDSLETIFNPSGTLKGHVGILNDPETLINMVLRFLGIPRCSTNSIHLERVKTLLREQRHWARYHDSEQMLERLISGELYVGQIWNWQALLARLEKSSLKYVYPKEGLEGWMDNLAITSRAPNLEAAKQFLNWFMQPENAASVSNFVRHHNGILGSETYMDAILANAPEIVPPPGARLPEFPPACPDKTRNRYRVLWSRL